MAALTHPVLSAAEFAAVMDRAGWKVPIELIEGEVVVIPPSGGEASLAQTEIIRRLAAWQTGRPAGGRLLSDLFIRIGAGYLAPDAAWWAPGNEPAIGPGAIQTLPDLVVEVLSPATRINDPGAKRGLYVGAGVRELWLVDPAERWVLIVGAAAERRLSAQDVITSPLLPDFAVVVGELFV